MSTIDPQKTLTTISPPFTTTPDDEFKTSYRYSEAPARLAPLTSLVEGFQPLDTYAGGLSPEPPRLDALATISAGHRLPGKDGHAGNPAVSRDGTIYLHDATGRAPGLAKALADGKNKRLTIAFPLDDPHLFIQQRYVSYSATRLLAYGDQDKLEVISEKGVHTEHAAGTDTYKHLVATTCKVAVSIYFTLAEWTPDGPAVVFPDGLGLYRLRTTSRHSLRSIIGTLKYISRFTKGRLAGVPFTLSIDYREVSDPTGAKRTIPCWTIVMQPPETIKLDSRTFAPLMQASLAAGGALMLPAPSAETVDAEIEYGLQSPLNEEDTVEAAEVAEPTDEEVALLNRGGPCDAGKWTKLWHVTAKGTPYDDPSARKRLITGFTLGATGSLSAYLRTATEQEAEELVSCLTENIQLWRQNEADDEEPDKPAEPEVAEFPDETGPVEVNEPTKAEYWLKVWEAAVQGTRFQNVNDEARFFNEYTGGRVTNAAQFFADASGAAAADVMYLIQSVVEDSESEQPPEPEQPEQVVLYGDTSALQKQKAVVVSEKVTKWIDGVRQRAKALPDQEQSATEERVPLRAKMDAFTSEDQETLAKVLFQHPVRSLTSAEVVVLGSLVQTDMERLRWIADHMLRPR